LPNPGKERKKKGEAICISKGEKKWPNEKGAPDVANCFKKKRYRPAKRIRKEKKCPASLRTRGKKRGGGVGGEEARRKKQWPRPVARKKRGFSVLRRGLLPAKEKKEGLFRFFP